MTNHLLPHIEPILRQAGQILLGHFRGQLSIRQKAGDQGIVTQADTESEQYLITELKKLMPEAAFLAEESGRQGDASYCWVIDPLDGTTNFAHGLPYFCISVALTYNNEPIFAAVYQPLLDEFFYAHKGGGAYLNGRKITVTDQGQFAKSMIVIGLPYAKNDWYVYLLDCIKLIGPKTYSIRHFGAAALDLAHVACGRLDGHFLADLRWWDIAAGILLVQEAGGLVTTFEGGPVGKGTATLVAANPGVHGQLRALVEKGKV